MKNNISLLLVAVLGIATGAVWFNSSETVVKPVHAQDGDFGGGPAGEKKAPVPLTIFAEDYASLQVAIDSLPAAGGIVMLAAQDYVIDQPLIIRTENTRITGAGAASHIINTNTEGMPAIYLRAEAGQGDNGKLWRVQLDNFRITGNENSGYGIHAFKIQEIFLQGLTVSYHGQSGIFLEACYEDPRVADCLMTYNKKAGLEIDAGHDIVVNANHFEENDDGVFCYDSYNLTCNANNFDDHLGNGIVIENTYGSVVSGNMIEECNGWAIILDRNCYGVTLSSNVIAHDMAGGIDLRDAWGCAVSANTFTLVHNAAVKVGPDSGRINISANAFSNSEVGGELIRRIEHENPLQLDVANGVLLEDTADILISGNTFTGLDGSAVVCRGKSCERISIQSNLVSDYGRRSDETPQPFVVPEGETILHSNNLVGPTKLPRSEG